MKVHYLDCAKCESEGNKPFRVLNARTHLETFLETRPWTTPRHFGELEAEKLTCLLRCGNSLPDR